MSLRYAPQLTQPPREWSENSNFYVANECHWNNFCNYAPEPSVRIQRGDDGDSGNGVVRWPAGLSPEAGIHELHGVLIETLTISNPNYTMLAEYNLHTGVSFLLAGEL